MKEIQMVEAEFNAWLDERERTLWILMRHAKMKDKLRYKAQIDFLSIVKINMSKILREVKQ
jgi:hypothetical protein